MTKSFSILVLVSLTASSVAADLSPLDTYRLWRARNAAVTNIDGRAVEKIVEAARLLTPTNNLPQPRAAELQQLLNDLERRLQLPPVAAVPLEMKPGDYAFAVPRRALLDIRFAASEGVPPALQSLDVYAPLAGDKHPIVVWIHGGGMKAGDKALAGVLALKPDFFLTRGFAFASINYRLAPAHKHPAQAEDTAAALAWLHDHAREFGGDLDNLFVIGISAGAQLAAVVSTNERFLAKHQKAPDIIRGAVILDIGSFDIPTLMEQAGANAPEMYHYTFRDGGTKEDWTDCSPLHHVKRGKRIPPMLLYYVAGRDHHAAENQRFADRLKAEEYDATVLAAENKTHLRIESEIGIPGDVPTKEILRFIEKRLKANSQ
jgi:arylformamidase